MPFKSAALKQYFSSKPGYRSNASVTQPDLNPVECQNAWLIEKLERIKGGRYRW